MKNSLFAFLLHWRKLEATSAWVFVSHRMLLYQDSHNFRLFCIFFVGIWKNIQTPKVCTKLNKFSGLITSPLGLFSGNSISVTQIMNKHWSGDPTNKHIWGFDWCSVCFQSLQCQNYFGNFSILIFFSLSK